MLCNRIVVTTDTGRNRELLDDNQTGFIAHAANAALLDEALERAWNQREQWREMGKIAGINVRKNYTANPIGDFAEQLTKIANDAADKRRSG